MHLSFLQGQLESIVKHIHSTSAPSCSLFPSLVHWEQQRGVNLPNNRPTDMLIKTGSLCSTQDRMENMWVLALTIPP